MSKKFTVSLFGLASLGLAVTGCGGGGGDGGDGALGLTWDLQLIGNNGSISCDAAGTPTVVLDTLGSNNFKSHDTFPCSTMTGMSTTLPRGTYQVSVALQNTAGQEVSAVQDNFTVNRGGVNPLPHLTFSIQTFSLSWTLNRGGSGVSCQEAGATTVRLITRIGNDQPVQYDFPCLDKDIGTNGSTTAIPIGTYSVQIQLLDGAGKVLSEVPATTVKVSSDAPADLPVITFNL
jgi:hypothetical protein